MVGMMVIAEEDDALQRVALARAGMHAARLRADLAASAYREAVRDAVASWRRLEKLSLRKCAERLGITEGALRDLLRAPGEARRAPKRRRSVDGS